MNKFYRLLLLPVGLFFKLYEVAVLTHNQWLKRIVMCWKTV